MTRGVEAVLIVAIITAGCTLAWKWYLTYRQWHESKVSSDRREQQDAEIVRDEIRRRTNQ